MVFTWWQAIILGAIQGLTEFLPVSSSGHLVLGHSLLGLQSLPMTFDILTHLGTLVAVIAYFWKKIRLTTWQYWVQVGIATIPAVVVGLLLKDSIEALSYNRWLLGAGFLISALFLFIAHELLKQEHSRSLFGRMADIVVVRVQSIGKTMVPRPLQSFLIGLLQALALIPSVSRSGSTLLGGLIVGLPRAEAFQFAFLVSLPAVLGANVLDLAEVWQAGEFAQIPWGVYSLGVLAAGVVGFISLRVLEYLTKKSRLDIFAWYLILVSILSFLFV